MTKLSILIFLLLSSVCFGGGGVDVGNGTSRSVLVHTPHTFSEIELESLLAKTIKKLKMHKDDSFNFAIANAKCSKKLAIGSIDQDSGFKINDNKVSFKRQYKGIIQVKLDSCEMPHLLPVEIKK
jgi:hypothetical protein